MNFKDILKRVEKGRLLLGYNDTNELNIDVSKNESIIITGETGSGKSILLDQILLELISSYTSLELELVLIDTSGVELNYYDKTNYTKYAAINDLDKSVVLLSKVLETIEKRKELLREQGMTTIKEYNETHEDKVPLLVVAIDDDKLLLRKPDIEKMLAGIISQIKGLNIMFVLATSDVYNSFFIDDSNIYASMLLSFDYTNRQEAIYANIEGAENLSIGSFLAKYDNNKVIYHNYEFEDSIIEEVMGK